jgi:hypothetical protein
VTTQTACFKVAIYRLDRPALDRAMFLLLWHRFTPFSVNETPDSSLWELRVTVDPPVYPGARDAMEGLALVGMFPVKVEQLSGTVRRP